MNYFLIGKGFIRFFYKKYMKTYRVFADGWLLCCLVANEGRKTFEMKNEEREDNTMAEKREKTSAIQNITLPSLHISE